MKGGGVGFGEGAIADMVSLAAGFLSGSSGLVWGSTTHGPFAGWMKLQKTH